VNPLLVPSCLAEETELLEAMEWDEEGMAEVLHLCWSTLSAAENEATASQALRDLNARLTAERGENVARLAISLFLKRSIQYTKQEIEA
jgi:hypothetical protein